MSMYDLLRTPPADALKPIVGGRLKGKSDINPQWKIEAMTMAFGACGIGWRHELARLDTVPLASGEIMIFMQVNVFVKQNDVWSDAIVGMGGDFLVQKEKSGLVANDEAYKMCYTDALGNALKCLGVAADVYRGFCDTKYGKSESVNALSNAPKPATGTNAPPSQQKRLQGQTAGPRGADNSIVEGINYLCDGCGAKVPTATVKWCKDNAEKYGGRILCYECQHKK